MATERKVLLRGCLIALIVASSGLVIFTLCVAYTAWALNLPEVVTLRSLPVYPDADIKIDGRRVYLTEFGLETKIMYGVHRPFREVETFYKEELRKQGWELNKEFDQTGGMCMVFRRGSVEDVSVDLSGYARNKGLDQSTTVILNTKLDFRSGCK